MMEDRKLTDGDVDAIVDALEKKMMYKFFNDLGQGVWGIVWKTVIFSLVGLAAYGSLKGIK